MSTSQKHAELKKLATAAKENIFRMLQLADEILSDHEYVDQFGGESHLIDVMEEQEFSHFGGTPKLSAMLRAYRETPEIRVWKEHAFNVWAMIELATPKRKKDSAKDFVSWKQRCKELELRLEQMTKRLEELREKNEKLQKNNAALNRQLGKLEALSAA